MWQHLVTFFKIEERREKSRKSRLFMRTKTNCIKQSRDYTKMTYHFPWKILVSWCKTVDQPKIVIWPRLTVHSSRFISEFLNLCVHQSKQIRYKLPTTTAHSSAYETSLEVPSALKISCVFPPPRYYWDSDKLGSSPYSRYNSFPLAMYSYGCLLRSCPYIQLKNQNHSLMLWTSFSSLLLFIFFSLTYVLNICRATYVLYHFQGRKQ